MKDIQKIKEFFSKPLDEKKETAIDMAKKQLDALGVKYELSGNEFKPFKAIYKPTNKPDRWYDKFEDIIHLFNLGSAVKQSMNEIEYLNPGKRPIITNKQGEKFVLQGFVTSGYYLIPYNGKKYWEHFSVPKNQWIPEKNINWSDYNFSEEQFNNLKASNLDSKKEIDKKFQDMNEAKSEDKVDTITMDIPLFLRMLEYSREDAEQDLDLHDVTEKANALGKEKGILSMEDYDAIVGAAEEIKEVNLKQSKLSSVEYQKAKKLKNFKASDWKWNKDEDLYTKVNEASDYMKRRKAMDDYAVSKKDKPKKSYNPTPSGKTDYMKRREKELAEAILAKLKK